MRIEQPDLPFFTRYNPPPSKGLDTGPDTMTHAECARDCDINYIMRRYASDGVLPNGAGIPLDGALQDFVGTDFQDLQNRMIQAREEFESLPSSVRDRFGNDPARLLSYLADAGNREEAERMGLVNKKPLSTDDKSVVNENKND